MHWRIWLTHEDRRAASRAACTAGRSKAIKVEIIVETISISNKLNPRVEVVIEDRIVSLRTTASVALAVNRLVVHSMAHRFKNPDGHRAFDEFDGAVGEARVDAPWMHAGITADGCWG